MHLLRLKKSCKYKQNNENMNIKKIDNNRR